MTILQSYKFNLETKTNKKYSKAKITDMYKTQQLESTVIACPYL